MEAYQRLEVEFGEWMGYQPEQVVACSSGTAALHLALEAIELSGEVIVPDYTMVACPRAVALAGLRPVFVDCDERLSMAPNLIQEIPNSVRAMMVVHVYGRKAHVPSYGSQVKIVEDLAEAHGVHPHPCTNAACWSFYRNKIVAGEEGGVVAFRDAEHARLARQLRSLGFTDEHDYWHVPRGHNYRLSNVHAELILASLHAYAENAIRRREIEAWYDWYCPLPFQQPPRDAVWVYDFRIKGMTVETQRAIVKALQAAGIAARYGFKPMRRQEEWNLSDTAEWESDRASREVIYLPVQPGVTTETGCRLAFEIVKRALCP